MHVDRYLFDVSIFVTFSIRIAVAWLFCFVCSRLLHRASHRFILWLVFSLGTAAYWAFELSNFIFSAGGSASVHLYPGALAHVVVSASWEPVFAAITWFLGGTYLLGFMTICTFRLYNRIRLRQLLQFGSKPPAELSAALDKLCREIGVKRCELVILPGIASPATVYWLRPRILFPEMAQQQTSEFLHIMRHELVHVLRRDYLVANIIDAICTLLFFHPAVWAAGRQMKMERELACDLAVIKACPEHRADYAASLTQFVRLSLVAKHLSSSVPFSAPASLLGRRIRSILLEPVSTPAWSRGASAGLVLTMMLTAVLFAPQASFSFNLSSREQLATVHLVRAERMKRHIRFVENGFPVP